MRRSLVMIDVKIQSIEKRSQCLIKQKYLIRIYIENTIILFTSLNRQTHEAKLYGSHPRSSLKIHILH